MFVMRSFLSLLNRRSTPADRLSPRKSRRHEAEFPSAGETAFELLQRALRSARARNRVPNAFGALRPHQKRNTEDQHGISITSKGPAFARRAPGQGRRLSAAGQSRRRRENAAEATNVLAENRELFRRGRKWRDGEDKCTAGAKWFVAGLAAARAAATAATAAT